MSETEAPYTAPGVRADWEAKQTMVTLLAYMPRLHQDILRGVAWILTLPPNPGIPAGWVAGRSIQKMHYVSVTHALATLCKHDLLQFDTAAGCYTLTSLGQRVAAALGEG